MPIKAAVRAFLDEISPESQITNAVNTVVKVQTPTGVKLVGQNTDILGVRNSLLRSLRLQFPDANIPSEGSYPTSVKGAGLVIGGGATTRSAAHALTLLGLSPIFLINRDVDEVREVMEGMPHLTNKGGLVHLRHPEDVEKHLAQADSVKILMAVGCIPAISPSTYAERMVYTTLMSVLTIPYKQPTESSELLPIPSKRLFLEMPYKPQRTPILRIAEALGWDVIVGIQAVIEQGLAQQRMWKTGIATVEVGSDVSILGLEVDNAARSFVENLKDIVVSTKEVDRASGKEVAIPRK